MRSAYFGLALAGTVISGALAFASAAQAGPLAGVASLSAAASQASPEAITQVGWQDRRYSSRRGYSRVRVSSNFRRTVDHGWHTGNYSRGAYPQKSCL